METKFIHPIIKKQLFMLISPDGNPQPGVVGEDIPQCVGFIKLLHKTGMGQSYHDLKLKGFVIEPVEVTIAPINFEN